MRIMLKFLRKKRFFAILVILFMVFLFYNTDWVGRLLYPVKYQDIILDSAEQYGMDPFLIAAIIRVETNFKTEKISKKGAIGLMQIMPDTAQWIIAQGEFSDLSDDKLRDPAVNIKAGAWYLQSLANQFESFAAANHASKINRIAVISAAYNAGPGNVGKWLSQGGWDGDAAHIDQIPFGETRHYIQRILYYYKKYEKFYAKGWNHVSKG